MISVEEDVDQSWKSKLTCKDVQIDWKHTNGKLTATLLLLKTDNDHVTMGDEVSIEAIDQSIGIVYTAQG